MRLIRKIGPFRWAALAEQLAKGDRTPDRNAPPLAETDYARLLVRRAPADDGPIVVAPGATSSPRQRREGSTRSSWPGPAASTHRRNLAKRTRRVPLNCRRCPVASQLWRSLRRVSATRSLRAWLLA